MDTWVLSVDPRAPDPALIVQAAEAIRHGKLVAFPTETVYGLGANALDPAAVRRIFAVKGRPPTNPIIVHVAHAEAAKRLVTSWPDEAARLAARFWPGPLTLVLPKTDEVPHDVTAGGPTVGLRVPSHPIALALLRAAAVPIAAPSANLSEAISPTTAQHVVAALGGRIELILDGGPTAAGLESTVVDLCGPQVRVLRPGPLTPSEVAECIGSQVAIGAESTTAPARAPGMRIRHYAPKGRLELLERSAAKRRVAALAHEATSTGWIDCQGRGFDSLEVPRGVKYHALPDDPRAYASRLYATLHELDQACVEVIVVTLPPLGEPWMAIHDRLQRASR